MSTPSLFLLCLLLLTSSLRAQLGGGSTASPDREYSWPISPIFHGELDEIDSKFPSGAPILLNFKLKNICPFRTVLPPEFCPRPDQKTVPIALIMEKAEDQVEAPAPSHRESTPTRVPDLMGTFSGNDLDGKHYDNGQDDESKVVPASAPTLTWHSFPMKIQPESAFRPPPQPAVLPTIPGHGEYELGRVDLTTLYDLSIPGVYRLTVSRWGDTRGATVIIITIMDGKLYR